MDYSDVYDEIGEFGPYQCLVCVSLAASMIPAVYANLNTIFITGVSEFWCAVPALEALNSSRVDIRKATIPWTQSQDDDVITFILNARTR